MLRLKFSNLQLNRYKTGQSAVIEQQVDIEVCISNLDPIFLTNKGKVPAELQNELLQIFNDCLLKISLRILLRQIKEFQNIGVQNTAAHILGSHFRNWFLCRQHTAFIICAVDLPLQFTFGVMLLSTEL